MSNKLPSYSQLDAEANEIIKLNSDAIEYRKLADTAQTPEDALKFDQIAQDKEDQADFLRMKIDQEQSFIAQTSSQNKTNTIKDKLKDEAIKKAKGVAVNFVKSQVGQYAIIGLVVILLVGFAVGLFVYVTSNPEVGLLAFNNQVCEKLSQANCTDDTLKEIGKKTANDIGLRLPEEKKL